MDRKIDFAVVPTRPRAAPEQDVRHTRFKSTALSREQCQIAVDPLPTFSQLIFGLDGFAPDAHHSIDGCTRSPSHHFTPHQELLRAPHNHNVLIGSLKYPSLGGDILSSRFESSPSQQSSWGPKPQSQFVNPSNARAVYEGHFFPAMECIPETTFLRETSRTSWIRKRDCSVLDDQPQPYHHSRDGSATGYQTTIPRPPLKMQKTDRESRHHDMHPHLIGELPDRQPSRMELPSLQCSLTPLSPLCPSHAPACSSRENSPTSRVHPQAPTQAPTQSQISDDPIEPQSQGPTNIAQLRPFTCDECGKSFKEKSTLQRHMVTHSSVRPYVCGTCNKSFKLAQHLTRHRKSQHCRPDSPASHESASDSSPLSSSPSSSS